MIRTFARAGHPIDLQEGDVCALPRRGKYPPRSAAGLYWYHTHLHGESYQQSFDGISGAILIDVACMLLLSFARRVVCTRSGKTSDGIMRSTSFLAKLSYEAQSLCATICCFCPDGTALNSSRRRSWEAYGWWPQSARLPAMPSKSPGSFPLPLLGSYDPSLSTYTPFRSACQRPTERHIAVRRGLR